MSKPKVLDLFCGGGGASMGFLKAGFDVVGAVDADKTAINTYEDNLCGEDTVVDGFHGEIKFDEPLCADLSRGYEDAAIDGELPTVSMEQIRANFDLDPGDIDVICGCPPCQNFSSLRDTDQWPEDKPKDSLLRAFVEFVEEEVPDIVFFENVRNIMTAGEEVPSTYVDWLTRSMSKITRDRNSSCKSGYGHALSVVNAADYGVPQSRRRTIGLFVYDKENSDVSLPDSTHAEDPDKEIGEREWVSVNEAFDQHDDLKQDIESGESQIDIDGYPDDAEHRARRHQQQTIDRMRAIRRHGGSWRDLVGTEDEGYIVEAHTNVDSGAASAYGIMDGGSPAPTLTTRCTTPSSGRFTHPKMDRAITFREAALLMTFPRWYELPDKNNHAERIVGNAVPPKLVESVADVISAELAESVTAN
jgi:DNA (cytosine-5)-methyltransferase 1